MIQNKPQNKPDFRQSDFRQSDFRQSDFIQPDELNTFNNPLHGCCKEPHTCCCVFCCCNCFYPYLHGVSLQNAKKS